MSGASLQAVLLVCAAIVVFALAGLASIWLVKRTDVGSNDNG